MGSVISLDLGSHHPEVAGSNPRTIRELNTRLVPLICDEVEHLRDGPLDHYLALDNGHALSLRAVFAAS